VFKVLKPGIEERLDQELGLLERVGTYLDERCHEFGIPHLDYEEVFQQVREKLRDEIRLDLEQRHLAQARATYAGEPRVLDPALFEHSTALVTAMELVKGGKVTQHGLDPPSDKRRLADLIIEALIARPIFATASPAVFHADPHAGNLFLTEDGRLALLDWSLVGALGEPERVALVQVLLAAMTLDADHVLTTLESLAERPPDRPALRSVIHAALRRVRWGQLPGLTWLTGLLDEAVLTARLRVGADLLLFRKTIHTLEGVLADVGAGSSQVDAVLLGEFLRHLAGEWPQRGLALPGCRAFATRLSNADLARLTLGLPWAAARFWAGLTLDLLSAGPCRAAC
jgi:ubiquinone biosynthesis protein